MRDRKKILRFLTLFLEVDFFKGTLIRVFQTLIYYRQFVTSLLHEEKENLLSLFFLRLTLLSFAYLCYVGEGLTPLNDIIAA